MSITRPCNPLTNNMHKSQRLLHWQVQTQKERKTTFQSLPKSKMYSIQNSYHLSKLTSFPRRSFRMTVHAFCRKYRTEATIYRCLHTAGLWCSHICTAQTRAPAFSVPFSFILYDDLHFPSMEMLCDFCLDVTEVGIS